MTMENAGATGELEIKQKIRNALMESNSCGRAQINLGNGETIGIESWFGGNYNVSWNNGEGTKDIAYNIGVDKLVSLVMQYAN